MGNASAILQFLTDQFVSSYSVRMNGGCSFRYSQ
ncbi:hypothetical protein FOM02_35525 [Bradyrhizobium sp. SEMIA]|nr:hypothetical protein FOM02_35525 [Bradyrhizobium sp. SEMIA]